MEATIKMIIEFLVTNFIAILALIFSLVALFKVNKIK